MGLLGTLALAVASTVTAAIPLEKVTDSTVSPPGVAGSFTVGQGIPCSGDVIFHVSTVISGEIVFGLYAATPGGLEVIANWTTPIPGSPGTFERARRPTCAGNQIVFPGDDQVGDSGNSLYSYSGGSLALFLEKGTPIDGNEFLSFNRVDANLSAVGIEARLFPRSTNQVLAIKPFGGDPFIVADRTMVLPGQADPVTIFSLPVMDGDDLVFRARTLQNLGIYRWSEGQGISVVADTATLVPVSGQGNFGTFGGFTILDEGTVFEAGYWSGFGLFIEKDGELQPFLLPGSTSTDGHVLEVLREPVGAGSLLAFRATPPGDPFRDAIFVRAPAGEVHRLLGIGDSIDGLEVISIGAKADAESVIIWMKSADVEPVSALYRATFATGIDIPALSGAGLAVLIACLAAAGLWIRRCA